MPALIFKRYLAQIGSIKNMTIIHSFFIFFMLCDYSYGESDFEKIQALLEQENSDKNAEILLPEGHFQLQRGLIANLTGVHIKGSGIDKTVLDFKEQIDGAPGISITGKDITVSNLTILNTAGDGIKASNSELITFTDLKVGWSSSGGDSRGSYGLYPVSSKGIRIEKCETFGATEAGIYVGQSESAVIINNKTYGNTVGIEAENSVQTLIKDNVVQNNSIGILVSDVPGLPVFGSDTEIEGNTIQNNNEKNVLQNNSHLSYKQSGLGVLLVAVKKAIVHNNNFQAHLVSDLVVLNYTSTNFIQSRLLYDPNVREVVVGINNYTEIATDQKVAESRLYEWTLPAQYYTALWDGKISQSKYYAPLKRYEHVCLEAFPTKSGIIQKKGGDTLITGFNKDDMLCKENVSR